MFSEHRICRKFKRTMSISSNRGVQHYTEVESLLVHPRACALRKQEAKKQAELWGKVLRYRLNDGDLTAEQELLLSVESLQICRKCKRKNLTKVEKCATINL